jgi:hypothetical protein
MNRQSLSHKLSRLSALCVVATGVILSIATSPPQGPSLYSAAVGPELALSEPSQSETFEVIVRANAAALTYDSAPEALSLTVTASHWPEEAVEEPIVEEEEGEGELPAIERPAAGDPPLGEGEGERQAAPPIEDDSRAIFIDVVDEDGFQVGAARETVDGGFYLNAWVDLANACEPATGCELRFIVTITAPTEVFEEMVFSPEASLELRYPYERDQDELADGAQIEVSIPGGVVNNDAPVFRQ